MKILCIYNPKARGGKAVRYLKQIRQLFVKHGIQAEIIITKYSRHATEIVAQADLTKYKALISAGGDGSFFDVLNGFMKNKNNHIPLGILPVGTGNSLSRDILSADSSLDEFVALIAKGNTKAFDIGKVQTQNEIFYFANMMGFGFTTDVTATASKLKFMRMLSYSAGVFYNTIKLKSYKLKMLVNQKIFDLDNVFITVSNSKYTGGNYLIAPKAEIDDGKLDIVVVNKLRRRDLLRTFPKIFDGSYIHTKFVDYIQAEQVKFEAETEKTISPDGELFGKLPIHISTIPKAIHILSA